MEILEGHNKFYVNDADGKQVAEIVFVPTGEHLSIIEHTDVDPSLKGQGVGKKLVAKVVEKMRGDVARRFFLHEKSKKIAQIKPVQLHCAKLIAKRLKVRKETFHFISAQRCRPVDHLPYMTVKVIRCPHIRATNAQA